MTMSFYDKDGTAVSNYTLNQKTVFITVPNYQRLIGEQAISLLQEHGFEIVGNATDSMATRPFLEQNIGSADAIIAGSERLDAKLLPQAVRLRMIARYGVGIDNIDTAYLEAHGIALTTTAGANANAVAEHTVVLMLSILRRIPQRCHDAALGNWKGLEFPELCGKTVGLIGFGRIAQFVAKKLAGFEVKLIAYDPYFDKETAKRLQVSQVSLDELLTDSDIISLHIPSTPDTIHFLSSKQFDQMKQGVYIVNTARGTLIDEVELYQRLLDGSLGGVALDVMEHEPCEAGHPLADFPQAIITPHMAGGSYESHQKSGMICAQAIVDRFDTMTNRTNAQQGEEDNERSTN